MDNKRLDMYNALWKDVFDSYKIYQDKITSNTWYEFLQTPTWYNDNKKVGGICVFYRRWFEKGIYYINDLFVER